MVTTLIVDGLRGVGRAELRFAASRRVYALFGPNGVGKTKCLEAIYTFLLLSNKTFIAESHGRPFDHFDTSLLKTVADLDGHSIAPVTNERQGFHDLPTIFLGAVSRSSFAEGLSGSHQLGTFAERRLSYFAGVAQAFKSRRLNSLGMNSDVPSWFVMRAQSVNPYQKESDNRQVEISSVLSVLNALDARIDAKFLQIDGAGRVSLRIEGQVRELSELSSGFSSLVKLIQAIVAGYANFTNETDLRNVRGYVLIDEIESHLHASWQATIVSRLKEAFPNTVFFVATHSPLVLAQLEEGEAYLLHRDDDGVVRTELISSPDRRAFLDVLESAFGVDVNDLKLAALKRDDQASGKAALLKLLQQGSSDK